MNSNMYRGVIPKRQKFSCRSFILKFFAIVCASFIVASASLIPIGASATVAFDKFSSSAQGTGNLSWSHVPVGTPRAVMVLVAQNVTTSSQITSVTYGSLTLSQVGSINCDTAGEPGCAYVYFGGSSIPTGTQTVTVTVSGAAAKRAAAVTLTANADTAVVTSDASIHADATNPTVTLSLSGRVSFVAEVFHGGPNNVSSITPFSGWTSQLENDYGSQVAGWYTYDTIGGVDVAAGWTQALDDAALIALAVAEPVVKPTDTTQSASSVTATTATANGTITDIGQQLNTVRGFAYGTDSLLRSGTGVSTTTENGTFDTGAFTGSLSSLTCGTNYYVRAYSTNTAGDGLGSIQPFTTSTCLSVPTVTTDSAHTFTPDTASMFGNLTNTGGETGAGTDYGFVYSKDSSFTDGTEATTSLGTYSGTGTFNTSVNGLTKDTTYFYRSYASNSAGVGYGSTLSFTTGDNTPSRIMRLFEGFVIKLISGTMKLFGQ